MESKQKKKNIKKLVSNSEIMNLFKEVDIIKSSNMPPDEIKKAVNKKHCEIANKLSFLVYSQAKQYRKFPNYDDLVQDGFIGLMRAIKKFKWNMFPNFFIYSNQWIRHYVKRGASRFDIVHSPDKKRVIYAEPDESEIDESNGPFEIFFDTEKQKRIDDILQEFPERDREVVKMIFGLGGHFPQTLREVGSKFDLTHEGVRKIKNNVLGKLKKNKKIIELNQS